MISLTLARKNQLVLIMNIIILNKNKKKVK